MTIAGIVRGNKVIPVRQGRDQVAEHARRCGETVQQQDRRCVLGPSLPVEDVKTVNLHSAVVNGAITHQADEVDGTAIAAASARKIPRDEMRNADMV